VVHALLSDDAMLRITRRTEDTEGTTLHVEGRITKAGAGELAAACEALMAQGGAVRLDLSGVRFADEAGAGALRVAAARGAVLAGASGFLQEVLKESAPVAPPPAPSADAELLARLRAGEESAFETLVRAYGGRMLAVARRFFQDEADARDAVQDGFLAAFRAIKSFEGGSRLSTWLHRIVVNAALMKLRSRRRRPEEPIEELLPRFDEEGHFAGEVRGWEPAACEALVERRETRAMVRRCIDRLPESYRTVLLLRDIEERDTDETAALLGISRQAVKTRLHRARQALRALVERDVLGAALSA
jgi:RNA polymerase sigma-70 factor (ECF subfamily)